MEKLITFWTTSLALCKKYEHDYSVAVAFYHHAMGASLYAQDLAFDKGDYNTCHTIENLWNNEWKAKFDEILYNK